jgi:hypothetical protein
MLTEAFTPYSGDALLTGVAGTEGFHNSPSSPCKLCKRAVNAAYFAKVDNRTVSVLSQYPLLRPVDRVQYADTPTGWFWEQWRKQGGDFVVGADGAHTVTRAARCRVTNHELGLTGEGEKTAFAPGVHNANMANTGGPSTYVGRDCELVCAEVNVTTYDVIESLPAAWDDLFARAARVMEQGLSAEGRAALDAEAAAFVQTLTTNWNNRRTKRLNGVTADPVADGPSYRKQINDLDVYTICMRRSASHRVHDTDRRCAKPAREHELNADVYYELWRSHPRCAYTGVLTTINNGPMRFSVERIDNAVGHTVANCTGIVRMLNGRAQMSRAKFLSMLLSQTRVPLSAPVREAAAAELAALPAP